MKEDGAPLYQGAQARVAHDGSGATLEIRTDAGKTERMFVPAAQLAAMTRMLIETSLRAAVNHRALIDSSRSAPMADMKIPALNMRVDLGAPGTAVLAFELGMFQLGFEVPAPRIAELGQALIQAGQIASSAPDTLQ